MKKCPACHAFNDDDAKFCTACGVYFSRAAADEPQPAAPAGDDEAQTEMGVTAPQELPMPANGGNAVHAESAAATGETPFSFGICNDSPMTPATLQEFYMPIKWAGIFVAAVGAVVLLADLVFSLAAGESADLLFFVIGIVWLLGGGLYLGMYYGYYLRNDLFFDGKRVRYVCDEEGLRQYTYDENGKLGEYLIPYGQIQKVTARKNLLVLHIQSGVLLPYRNAFTQGTEADFLALLRNRGVNVKVR